MKEDIIRAAWEARRVAGYARFAAERGNFRRVQDEARWARRLIRLAEEEPEFGPKVSGVLAEARTLLIEAGA